MMILIRREEEKMISLRGLPSTITNHQKMTMRALQVSVPHPQHLNHHNQDPVRKAENYHQVDTHGTAHNG